MNAIANRRYTETTAQLELRALEKMIGALCAYIERLAGDARAGGRLRSREAELQVEVFAERRQKALQQLKADTSEALETRIARLDRVVEALDCSRDYFFSAAR
jgi:uncharacterized membrane protein YccC